MYQSIDILQKALSNDIFAYTSDAKKAAGRSLGTIVEIITFYLLREWGLIDNISIERALPEYGNASITHNVEFTLHPILGRATVNVDLPATASRVLKEMPPNIVGSIKRKPNSVLDSHFVLRNSCLIGEDADKLFVANVKRIEGNTSEVDVSIQHANAFAMFECKRVGIEEGSKKGPQTIEKAKQGAYVAQKTSSLQKVRDSQGQRYGLMYHEGKPILKDYDRFLDEIVNSNDLLEDFILSVGIVSNHGNWFTSGNQNKELKVLSESYDWLLFLTDEGFSTFINNLLLHPEPDYTAVKDAFRNSYREGKKVNIFTKTKIDLEAHTALCKYFAAHVKEIENWFNVITPKNKEVKNLKGTLFKLRDKEWRNIL